MDGVVRAKKRPYIPVVLSREEVDRVIALLPPPRDLAAKLLYGCGLRLFECLKLRVQDINFDMGVLTVHDGKGQKDRTLPLPKVLLPELRAQLDEVIRVHRADLAAGCSGTFLPARLEQKFKSAAKELVWQWFFPATKLTSVPGGRRNAAVITCTKPRCKRPSKRPCGRRGFPSVPRRIPFGTAMPRTFCRRITTSAPSRSCWVTAA